MIHGFNERIFVSENLQVMGNDVIDVSAPVKVYVIALLSMAASQKMKWENAHIYIKSVFLKGEMERELSIYYPYNLTREFKRGHKTELKKALLGLSK